MSDAIRVLPPPGAMQEWTKPPVLLAMVGMMLAGVGWWATREGDGRSLIQTQERQAVQLAELRVTVQRIAESDVEQRVSIARLTDTLSALGVRTDQQIDRIVRVQERLSADVSRALLYATPPDARPPRQQDWPPVPAPDDVMPTGI